MEQHFAAGDHILLRHVHRGRVHYVNPVTVVQDTPERIVYFLEIGTPCIGMTGGSGPRDFAFHDRNYEFDWADNRALHIVTPGAAHAVIAFWRGYHEKFLGWYINLQEPLRRTAIGFDTMDHVLDVQVHRDLVRWQWKDEDEVEYALEHGWFTPEEAAAVRAEGERALQIALGRRPPYTEGWDLWTPDPTWSIPTLPEGWDRIADSG